MPIFHEYEQNVRAHEKKHNQELNKMFMNPVLTVEQAQLLALSMYKKSMGSNESLPPISTPRDISPAKLPK
jgi:hypothetical protein